MVRSCWQQGTDLLHLQEHSLLRTALPTGLTQQKTPARNCRQTLYFWVLEKSGCRGEGDRDGRADVHLTFQLDAGPVDEGNVLDNGQPQTGAPVALLRLLSTR